MQQTLKYVFLLTFLLVAACSDKKVIANNNPLIIKNRKPIYQTGPTGEKSEFQMLDKTSAYGLADVAGVHFYAVDFNQDYQSDLVVLSDYYAIPQFYAFKDNKFQELKNVMRPAKRASFLRFYDVNRDQVPDMFVATFNQKTALDKRPLELYIGQKTKQGIVYNYRQDIYAPSALSGLALFDFDLDGELDFFLANWFSFKDQNKAEMDRLLKGKWNGKHIEITDATGNLVGESEFNEKEKIYPNVRPSFSVSTCDINQDGLPDILTTSTHRYNNRLWMNAIDKKNNTHIFTDNAEFSGFAKDNEGNRGQRNGGHSFFSACTDYNNDGFYDIFIGELLHSYDSIDVDRSSILTGAPSKKFIRTEYTVLDFETNANQSDRRAIWVDLNFDGLIDLLVDNSGFPPHSRLLSFMQNSDHSYDLFDKGFGLNILNPSGTIYLDLNQDGRPDIITGSTNLRAPTLKKRIFVLENNIPYSGNRSLWVTLKGKKANSYGLGATLILKTNKRSMRQYVEDARGPLPSQNENFKVFGLAPGEKALSIEVVWPYKVGKAIFKQKYSLKKIQFEKFAKIEITDDGKYRLIK